MNRKELLGAVESLYTLLPNVTQFKRLRGVLSKESSAMSSRETEDLFDTLWHFMTKKNHALVIAEHFTPILLELLVHSERKMDKDDLDARREMCLALGHLVGRFTDAARFCYQYFQNKPSIFVAFKEDYDALPKKRRKKKKPQEMMLDFHLLKAALQFLSFDAQFFMRIWDWSCLIPLLDDSRDDVRWMAYLCVAIVTGMHEKKIRTLFSQTFSENVLHYEAFRNYEFLRNIYPAQVHYLPDSESKEEICASQLDNPHYCPNVVSVAGILLLKCEDFKRKLVFNLGVVEVPSVRQTLYEVAMSVAIGKPVLLEGPIGSGKTTIVEHLAELTGREDHVNFVKVQLGDQTDSKILVGSYCCTDIPGEFVWRAGPLTEAMQKGKWLLLEDIDNAPHDVISLLVGVLENQMINLPGYVQFSKARTGFQIFLTRRLVPTSGGVYLEGSSYTDLLNKLWKRITIDVPSRPELEQIITTKWPNLKPVVDRILEIYFMMSSEGQKLSHKFQSVVASQRSRLVSTRDLYKWCQRISKDFSSKSCKTAINVFLDALDCFCGSITRSDQRLLVAVAIGEKLNLPREKVYFCCMSYKPKIESRFNDVVIGRGSLERKDSETIDVIIKRQTTFAHTRQASALLESIAVAVQHSEPVLLVGETGIGKTSLVQHLADVTGHKLIVLNLSQQSDTIELLGGYKPVDLKYSVAPLRSEFESLFSRTFSTTQNVQYLGYVLTAFKLSKWDDMFWLMMHIQNQAVLFSHAQNKSEANLLDEWKALKQKIIRLQQYVQKTEAKLVFAFVEGVLVKAMKEGCWILLDEINLAEAETLKCLGGLLDTNYASVVLLEKGDQEAVVRHEGFRLFACMNPATDVGKKDLPPGIRNRFTEFFMEELESESDLQILTNKYLQQLSPPSEVIHNIVKFYLDAKVEATSNLCDGTGHGPHYSLRTLCRALDYAASNKFGNILRSLYEAFCLSFLTQLDRVSHPKVQSMIASYILGRGSEAILKQPLPLSSGNVVNLEGYWVECGPQKMHLQEHYLLTDTVKLNLKDLVRIVSASRYPVLLQGETSVGKTSLVQWLAKAIGFNCIRVNNHEHTDLQEYVGSYAVDISGKLVFKEGILVEAMRQGHWIILDELNLAPTEVLEALNRVLDDNRELFIAETQEVVKAHQHFMLFATQNPPGTYGGRKMLSRAFRNRFIELHFDEIPAPELENILHHRCALPPSYCRKLVAVMQELQIRRNQSGVTYGKQGFMTLRDLFRWGRRYHSIEDSKMKFYDWEQHLADEGYLLLAGKVRRHEEEAIILDVLKKHFKRDVNPQSLFASIGANCSPTTAEILMSLNTYEMPVVLQHLVWTFNMRRLAVLVGHALQFNEPVLLVGDTGCGKTTICQLFAHLKKRKLLTVNCHMHSESSDFLGCLRPVRSDAEKDKGNLFEWVDGPLVTSMKEGHMFLSDEISLADDSVLERLNSVLEMERSLLLAEKGDNDCCVIEASPGFEFLATMNPGGDYGKKELSPALRNRFTEIWCPSTNSATDIMKIIEHNVISDGWVSQAITEFFDWFKSNSFATRFSVSLRDILTWVTFINCCATKNHISPEEVYIHGACIVLLDSIVVGTGSEELKVKKESLQFLVEQVQRYTGHIVPVNAYGPEINIGINKGFDVPMTLSDNLCFGIHPFYIEQGSKPVVKIEGTYTLSASTVNLNALRLLRGMQLNKPILLEGAPGVGKTTLVTALAKASRNGIVRINLSEQTDVSDLFGADLPIDGGEAGQFGWRDGPVLQALKAGHWILLDELNLAPQPVLEGLNACLDHRGEIFVPELGKSFSVPVGKTRIFGCQNPQKQGGARKGLPRSFLNRFIQVYMEPLPSADLEFISRSMFPNIPSEIISKMVLFNEKLNETSQKECAWSSKVTLWELNLRDLFRWCEIMQKHCPNALNDGINPGEFVHLIYADRVRNICDKIKVLELYKEIFGDAHPLNTPTAVVNITHTYMQVGHSFLPRICSRFSSSRLNILHHQLNPLQSLMKCIEMNWMAILVGPSASGKTSLVHLLGILTGHPLSVLTVNSEMDTTELLGGFEQVNLNRQLGKLCEEAKRIAASTVWSHCLNPEEAGSNSQHRAQEILSKMHNLQDAGNVAETVDEKEHFMTTIKRLSSLLSLLDSEPETKSLSDELSVLQKKADVLGNICSGGKFEWVDSVLVSAMKSGRWLLVDDVNFCSPSVLDRLNPLLEPNGVLTISEQGVVDGIIPVVKPHPDFRLILAMDPKNGEISRAMRNRGVEIYLVGEDQGGGPDRWDMQLLLQSAGITRQDMIDCLLRVHDSVKTKHTGPERPSLQDLLQAGQLCVQHMHLGAAPQAALLESSKTTYVRGMRNHAVKEKLESFVENEVLTLSSSSSSNTVMTQLTRTPAMFYQIMSDEVMAHSLGSLFEYLLLWIAHVSKSDDNLKSCTWKVPNDLYELPSISSRDEWFFAIVTAISLLIETCSHSVWTASVQRMISMCHSFIEEHPNLKDVLENVCCHIECVNEQWNVDDMSTFREGLISKTDDPYLHDVLDLPLDFRSNPALLHRLVTNLSIDDRQNTLNQLASEANRLLLWTIVCDLHGKMQRKTAKKFSPYQKYSLAELSVFVQKDECTDDVLPHPAVIHLSAFINNLISSLLGVVRRKAFLCSDDTYFKFKEVIMWTDAFLNICYQRDDPKLQISRFSLYWIWMSKHVLQVLLEICVDQKLQIFPAVEHLSQKISESLHKEVPPFHKLRSKLSQKLDSTRPLATQLHAEIKLRVLRLEKRFEWKPLQQTKEEFVKLWNLRSTVHSKSLEIFQSMDQDQFDLSEARLQNMESNVEEGLAQSSTHYSDTYMATKAVEIQMLPVWDHLTGIDESHLLACVMEKMFRGSVPAFSCFQHLQSIDDKCTRFVTSEMKSLMIPSSYLHVLMMSTANESRHLLPSLLLEFLKHQKSLLSLYKTRQLLLWHPILYDVFDEEKSYHKLFDSKYKMSLSEMCFTLIGGTVPPSFEINCGSVDLLLFGEKCKQMERLKDILWRNSHLIATPFMSERFSKAVVLCIGFERILAALGAVAKIDISLPCNQAQLASLWNILELPKSHYPIMQQACQTVSNLVHELSAGGPFLEKDDFSFALGEAWASVGFITAMVFTPWDTFDPTLKKEEKLQLFRKQINDIAIEVGLRDWMSLVRSGQSLKEHRDEELHPILVGNSRRKLVYKQKCSKLEKNVAIRPNESEFQNLIADIRHHQSSVGSPSNFTKILKMLQCQAKSRRRSRSDLLKCALPVVKQVDTWLQTQEQFLDKISSEYPLYQDIVLPFASGISQMIFGVSMLKHSLALHVGNSNLSLHSHLCVDQLVSQLSTFPYISHNFSEPLSMARYLCKESTLLDISSIVKAAEEPLWKNKICKAVLEKAAFIEILNQASVSSKTGSDKELSSVADAMFFKAAESLFLFEMEKKDAEQEKEQTFQYKTKHHVGELSENEQDEEGVANHFPSYQSDFHGLEETDMDTNKDEVSLLQTEETGTSCDQYELWQMHRTLAKSLISEEKLHLDFKTPFLLRYHVAKCILQSIGPLTDVNNDKNSFGSHLMACQAFQSIVSSEVEGKSIDVYRGSNPSEVVKCHPLLEELNKAVINLLSQFPEHPTLSRMLMVVRRILSFPVTSPIMKFITGLEILLETAQDWEKMAHKGISMQKELANLTSCIIQWRKLELCCWSQSLDTKEKEHYKNAAKYWSYLYKMLYDFINKANSRHPEKEDDLVQALVDFFERSTLGEYEARLDLIQTFIGHCFSCSQSEHAQRQVQTILINIYQYYLQFLPRVIKSIVDQRQPLDKTLKDFVKITQWNDINFWAVKQAVTKSHHVIHRRIKLFEKVLQQPSRPCMILQSSSEKQDESWKYPLVTSNFLISGQPERSSDTTPELLRLSFKARKLSRKIMASSPFVKRSEMLNVFAGDIISTASELQAGDVTQHADKEKQKAEARNLNLRKRRALSDLFKALRLIGLSYQKGTMYCRQSKLMDIMTASPLAFALKQTDCPRVQAAILAIEGCNKYFYKSAAKFSMLKNLLQTPQEELGLPVVQRLQGYAGNLFETIIFQQAKLSRNLLRLENLRNAVSSLESIVKENDCDSLSILPPQNLLLTWMNHLDSLLVESTSATHQCLMLLECCPLTSVNNDSSIMMPNVHPIVTSRKGDAVWTEMHKTMNDILRELSSLLDSLRSHWPKPSKQLLTWQCFGLLRKSFLSLKVVAEHFDALSNVSSGSGKNVLMQSLSDVSIHIVERCEEFGKEIATVSQLYDAVDVPSAESDKTSELVCKTDSAVEKLVHLILLCVQNMYRKSSQTECTTEAENRDELVDKHLTEKLNNSLSETFVILNAKKIRTSVGRLLSIVSAMWELDSSPCVVGLCARKVSTVIPLLMQYVNLFEYCVLSSLVAHRISCKLLYVLLNLFVELAEKGFCLPPELQKEMQGEGATQFEDIQDGVGLGEGEGTKDVSERLESEDQLEDQEKKEQDKVEEKPDDKDLKDEEQGVEMSEDFEGKLHDPEDEADDNEDNREDHDDQEELDKQMGNVDQKESEKLDEKLWGDDNDEEEEDAESENEFGSGEQQTEAELVAKTGQDEEKNQKQDDKNQNKELKDENLQDDDVYTGEQEDPYKADNWPQESEDMTLPDNLLLDEEVDTEVESEAQEDDDMNLDAQDSLDDKAEEEMETDGDGKDEEVSDLPEEDENMNEDSSKATETHDNPSEDTVQASVSADKGSRDQVDQSEPAEEGQSLSQSDERGVGESDANMQDDGYEGARSSSTCEAGSEEATGKKHSQTLDEHREERHLGDSETAQKLHTTDKTSVADLSQEQQKSDTYEHIRKEDIRYDAETVDLATEDQAEVRPVAKNDEGDTKMEDDEEILLENKDKTQARDAERKLESVSKNKKDSSCNNEANRKDNENETMEDGGGEHISTLGAARGPESTIHTQHELWSSMSVAKQSVGYPQTPFTMDVIPLGRPVTSEAEMTWRQCERAVSSLVQELCEQLRLVLEPTKTAKMKGDYRTGKRLNMRKVIPYIASQFRKDKIWLRRTKPSKRQYQIVIAIDDSSSMADNQSRQMAFESLALLGKTLMFLEAGELAVVSFGESVKLVHPLGETFSDSAGARILQELSFAQEKTRVADLLNFSAEMLSRHGASKDTAQLLIIVSDGRGIFNEGESMVRQAVRRVKECNIFTVFVILDNPLNKDSILDVKTPIFSEDGQGVQIQSYMQRFPFPFYLILRDISAMPVVLGDALRQWFELVVSSDR